VSAHRWLQEDGLLPPRACPYLATLESSFRSFPAVPLWWAHHVDPPSLGATVHLHCSRGQRHCHSLAPSDLRTIELTNERASSTLLCTHRCGRCVVADVAADCAKPGCQERDASTESRHVHADREEGGRRCEGQLVKVTALLTFTTRSPSLSLSLPQINT
jgi:hypothetical protein